MFKHRQVSANRTPKDGSKPGLYNSLVPKIIVEVRNGQILQVTTLKFREFCIFKSTMMDENVKTMSRQILNSNGLQVLCKMMELSLNSKGQAPTLILRLILILFLEFDTICLGIMEHLL